jgi:hypothetical protein
MVCYALQLKPEMAPEAPWTVPVGPLAAVATTRMAQAEYWAESAAPWQTPAGSWSWPAPRLFLVREAVAEPYRAKEASIETPVLTSYGDGAALPGAEICEAPLPEPEVGAAALPESDGDVLDALEEEIVALSAHIHAATHRLLTLIAEYDRLLGWELAGHRSCAHWLAYRTGLDLGTAREKVRAARALERLPETSAAMARGELSFSQVRALSRVATAENEGDLLELARGCTTAQLERMVRAFRKGTEGDEAEAEKRRYRSRTLSVFPDDDGIRGEEEERGERRDERWGGGSRGGPGRCRAAEAGRRPAGGRGRRRTRQRPSRPHQREPGGAISGGAACGGGDVSAVPTAQSMGARGEVGNRSPPRFR